MYELTDIEELREEFSATRECIYLDNAFWSPLPATVVRAVTAFLHDRQYAAATKDDWNDKILEVKGKVGRLIGCSMHEIAFTKNTTAGLSIAANGLGLKAGDSVVVTDRQSEANLYPWLNLRKLGVDVKMVRVKGREVEVSVTDFEKLIDAGTKAIAIDHVEAQYGFKRDISMLGELCRCHGLVFIVDAAQSCGAIPIDVEQQNIDMLSFHCFKWLLSPFGTGCFYCEGDLVQRVLPTEVGDRSGTVTTSGSPSAELIFADDATRFESGNLSYAGVYGLDAALDMILDIGVERIQRKILSLTDALVEGLFDLGLNVLSPVRHEFRSGIVSFVVDDPVKTWERLREKRIYVSILPHASATAGNMGVSPHIRVSPHFYNVKSEIDVFLRTLSELI